MTCYGPLILDNNPCYMFIRLASFSDIKPNKYKYELLKETQSAAMAFSMYYQHSNIIFFISNPMSRSHYYHKRLPGSIIYLNIFIFIHSLYCSC